MTQLIAPRQTRIRRALDHLRNGTADEFDAVRPSGPEEFTHPEIARCERDLLFGRVPSIVAHGSDVPEPKMDAILAAYQLGDLVAFQTEGYRQRLRLTRPVARAEIRRRLLVDEVVRGKDDRLVRLEARLLDERHQLLAECLELLG